MEEIAVQKTDMPNEPYTIAGRRGFLHRYADTGFKTKWTGIWFPPFKFFEYFAFSVNGEWLSPQNAQAFDIKKGEAVHSFTIADLDIEERLAVTKKAPCAVSVLLIKNSSEEKKEISISLEAALNIRTKFENIHQRTYEASFSGARNAVIVKSEDNRAIFGVGRVPEKVKVSFEKNEAYKEHSPGGELQRCFIPGRYTVAFELGAGKSMEIPFMFSRLGAGSDSFSEYDKCFKDWKGFFKADAKGEDAASGVITPDMELNEAYLWAADNMQNLIHDAEFGTGLFAGYPWFLEFWGRDTFWSVKGLIDAGRFDEAKSILRTMASFQKKRMPCVVNLDKTASYHGADVDALFLIALDYYASFSGDNLFAKEMERNMVSSLDSAILLDYLVQHEPQETWMDSLCRPSTAVEIQSFWIEALKSRDMAIAKRMQEKLLGSFWNKEDGFLYDTAGDVHSARKTANALFPLVFGQLQNRDAFAVLDVAKNELASPFGIRTLSKNDKDYSPSAYHSGASWGFTTAIAACAALNYARTTDGLEYLKILSSDARKHLGGMSECLNSETGELMGCSMQLWSSALFVHAVDAYLFGVSYSAHDKKLTLTPRVPDSWKYMERKGKRAGEDVFDFSIVRTKKGYEAYLEFRTLPKHAKAEIILPENIKGALFNGKKLKLSGERSVEFSLEKSNTITLSTV